MDVIRNHQNLLPHRKIIGAQVMTSSEIALSPSDQGRWVAIGLKVHSWMTEAGVGYFESIATYPILFWMRRWHVSQNRLTKIETKLAE
jgi:hypothetical protein